MLDEARLLLAKLVYAQGHWDEALSLYQATNVEDIRVPGPTSHRVRMLAEAWAIYGICLEKIMPGDGGGRNGGKDSPPPLSPLSDELDSNPEKAVIQCFERSGDLSLLYLQECDKSRLALPTYQTYVESGQLLSVSQSSPSPLLDYATRRAPLLMLQGGDKQAAVSRFRSMLQAVEARSTRQLRQTLARQLAQLLLRGISEWSYRRATPPSPTHTNKSHHHHHHHHHDGSSLSESPPPPLQSLSSSSSSPSSRLQPRLHSGLFRPANHQEETLLLLLISECLATQEAVLNRSSDHEESRVSSVAETTSVYDCLSLVLVRDRQFHMLADSFERAMKFSHEDFHVWYQFGLSLIAAGKFRRASFVLEECARLRPSHYQVRLMSARLCLERLQDWDSAANHAKIAIDAALEANDSLNAAKGFLCSGLSLSFQSDSARLHADRRRLFDSAIDALTKGAMLDPYDHATRFHLAYLLATNRQTGPALLQVRQALSLRPDHPPSLHLLSLLLTSSRKWAEACSVIDSALEEFPDDVDLLLTRARIKEELGCVEESLSSVKGALKIWRERQEAETEAVNGEQTDEAGGSANAGLPTDPRSSDKRHPHQQTVHIQISSELSERDSGGGASLTTPSLATTSRVDQTISDAASSWSLAYSQLKSGPRSMWELQVLLWLHLADHYLRHERLTDASAAVMEAIAIGHGLASGPQVIFMRGRVHECAGEFDSARRCFADTIAILPNHLEATIHLGLVTLFLGSPRLAEKILRDAVRLDPRSHDAWRSLGRVLSALGDHQESADCFLTALDLQTSAPVLPFTVIPKTLF